eukprot:6851207-Prymnesium_polylepis.1
MSQRPPHILLACLPQFFTPLATRAQGGDARPGHRQRRPRLGPPCKAVGETAAPTQPSPCPLPALPNRPHPTTLCSHPTATCIPDSG